MNKLNNISNRSSVLPILCEHGQFSAIVERTQSDHSDCRHWMEGVLTTKPFVSSPRITNITSFTEVQCFAGLAEGHSDLRNERPRLLN